MTNDPDARSGDGGEEPLVLPPPRPKPRLSPTTAAVAVALLLAAAFYGGVRANDAWGDDAGSASTGKAASAKETAKIAPAPDKGFPAKTSADKTAADKTAIGKVAAGKAAAGWAVGTVSAVSKRTLFVTADDGSVVAVEVPAGAYVTKTQTVTYGQIRPGDRITASGAPAGKKGVVVAASVAVGVGGVDKAGLKAGYGVKPTK